MEVRLLSAVVKRCRCNNYFLIPGLDSMMEVAFKELLQKGKNLVSEMKLSEASALYQNWLKSDLTLADEDKNSLTLEKKSRLALVYNNMGQVKYLKVDFEGAVQDYDRAILYDPELAPAYYNRGTIMYRMGDFSAAVKDMGKATSLNPGNEEFRTGLERAKLRLNEMS